jgi:glucose-6-phosphate-specific signal transduction histidine kinase
VSEYGSVGTSEAELSAQISELTRQLTRERAARKASERALLEAMDDDQRRLAALLHDTSCQSINAARIYVRVARDTIQRSCPNGAAVWTTLEEAVQAAADELQALNRWLDPTRLDGMDLVAGLAQLTELAARSAACEFRCHLATIDAELAAQAELLRIAQLAIVALVARRQASVVELNLDERELVLEIRAAADALPDGLEVLLDARARVAGGSFTLRREAEHGSTLRCRLPRR